MQHPGTSSRRGLLAILPVLLVSWIGCGAPAKVRLVQPHMAGLQREVRLASQASHWAAGPEVVRVLVEFPLPGATTGEPMYLLYLRLPAGVAQPPVGGKTAGVVQGFLVQTRGRYAGLTRLTRGTVVVHGQSQSAGATRRLDFELTFDDGSRLVGQALARRDPWRLQRFEEDEHPADVKRLTQQQQ